MSRTWMIADQHFEHTNIIKYTNRPFDNVKQMNEVLVNNWNKKVRQEDVVYVLGDFALSDKEGISQIGRQLNGKKTLIMGNHDRKNPQVYYDAGFRFVSKYPVLLEEKFLLSHHPMFEVIKGSELINIYGHVHNNEDYEDYTENTFCVSVERIDYTPIRFNEIKKKLRKM